MLLRKGVGKSKRKRGQRHREKDRREKLGEGRERKTGDQRFTSEWTKIWKMEVEGRKKKDTSRQEGSDCKEGTEILREGTAAMGYRTLPTLPHTEQQRPSTPHNPATLSQVP